MHRIDEKLMKLDAHFESAAGEEKQMIEKEIKVFKWDTGIPYFCWTMLQ